ncbi:hypothetical protein NQZ68_025866 [Scomber scombrus]|uniref:Uncharacterized protein n=1 Tax=Scomber scombrus TaxID=13677 RepID=A0AAV1MVT8_SCOSC
MRAAVWTQRSPSAPQQQQQQQQQRHPINSPQTASSGGIPLTKHRPAHGRSSTMAEDLGGASLSYTNNRRAVRERGFSSWLSTERKTAWSRCRVGEGLSRMEIDARFRYYFQHPWSRLIVAYLVTFFNFLIFAEDPISHSQTEAHMIVVGNCFSFLFNKYPGLGWNILKVVCWILAIITGMVAGKFIFHRQLFGKSCTQ